MSLMEKIFGAKAPQQQPQQPGITNNLSNNPQPPAPQSSAQTAPNGVVPQGSNAPADPTKSPEDKFAKLWETPATDPNAPKDDGSQNLTPEKMLEAAGKVDFKRILDPAALQKIAAGGEEAVSAMAELLNKTAQTVYGQSTVVAQKLIETQVQKARDEFTAQLPSLVKKQTMQESLLTENPAFKQPSVAPVVTAIQNQLATKYPNATAAELNGMAKEYLKQAAEAFNPTPKTEPTAAQRGTDWDKWVEQGT